MLKISIPSFELHEVARRGKCINDRYDVRHLTLSRIESLLMMRRDIGKGHNVPRKPAVQDSGLIDFEISLLSGVT